MNRSRVSLLAFALVLLVIPATGFAAEDAVKEMAVGLAKKSGARGFEQIVTAILFPKEKIDFEPLKVFLTEEMKRQLDANTVARAIHRHEAGAIAARRLAEVNERLAQVTKCVEKSRDETDVRMRFEDKKEGWFSQSQASNGDVATARCNGQRDLHEATLTARVLKSIDPAYEKDVEVLDLWAQTLDKLDPLPDGASRRALFMDFGGTYGFYFAGVWPNS